MKCPKCGSEKVNTQVIQESSLKTKHHSIIYWLLIGWWAKFLLWFFLTLPMLIIKIFKGKKQKLVTTSRTVAVCQDCGYQFNI